MRGMLEIVFDILEGKVLCTLSALTILQHSRVCSVAVFARPLTSPSPAKEMSYICQKRQHPPLDAGSDGVLIKSAETNMLYQVFRRQVCSNQLGLMITVCRGIVRRTRKLKMQVECVAARLVMTFWTEGDAVVLLGSLDGKNILACEGGTTGRVPAR